MKNPLKIEGIFCMTLTGFAIKDVIFVNNCCLFFYYDFLISLM